MRPPSSGLVARYARSLAEKTLVSRRTERAALHAPRRKERAALVVSKSALPADHWESIQVKCIGRLRRAWRSAAGRPPRAAAMHGSAWGRVGRSSLGLLPPSNMRPLGRPGFRRPGRPPAPGQSQRRPVLNVLPLGCAVAFCLCPSGRRAGASPPPFDRMPSRAAWSSA